MKPLNLQQDFLQEITALEDGRSLQTFDSFKVFLKIMLNFKYFK